MNEPGIADRAVFHPGKCFVCGGIEGRMIDTRVDIVGDGRIYFCERTCMPMFGRLLGYATPVQVAELEAEAMQRDAEIADLKVALAEEKDRKTISLSELADYVRVAAPEPKPKPEKKTAAA